MTISNAITTKPDPMHIKATIRQRDDKRFPIGYIKNIKVSVTIAIGKPGSLSQKRTAPGIGNNA